MLADLALQIEHIVAVCWMSAILLFTKLGMLYIKDKARYVYELTLLVERNKYESQNRNETNL